MVRTVGIEPDIGKRIRKRQGKAIRQTRVLRDLTIDELAERLDVSPAAISHWETGRYTPRQHHQIAIAQALGVPWGVLFGLDGEAA